MRVYYHTPEDEISFKEEIIVLAVLVTVWWGIVHFLDWLTFDVIPWWLEPFTLLLMIPILMMFVEFGKNPLHWWPLIWGTKVKIEGNDFMAVWRREEAFIKYGGPKNVYYNGDYIKFRKSRDAFEYCLTNQRLG
jgi:hypothetical protein